MNCYSTCDSCSESSTNETDQKCLSCKDNHLDLIDGNCIEKPTPTTNILLTTEYSVQTEGEISCPKGNYLSEENICLNCTNICKDYEHNSCDCISCYNGYYLDQDTKRCNKCDNICDVFGNNVCACLICPLRYGLEDDICVECVGCEININNTCRCLKCFDGYYLDDNQICQEEKDLYSLIKNKYIPLYNGSEPIIFKADNNFIFQMTFN